MQHDLACIEAKTARHEQDAATTEAILAEAAACAANVVSRLRNGAASCGGVGGDAGESADLLNQNLATLEQHVRGAQLQPA